MKKLVYILLALTLFSSCEDQVDLDIVEGPRKLVVEGGVTDEPGPYQISLTWTQDVNSIDPNPTVDGAIVIIKENDNVIDTLNELGSGLYETVSITQGVVGNVYQLYVRTSDGVEYESIAEEMQQVTAIDSLFFRTKEEITPNFFLTEGVYYPIIAYQDPGGIANYYRVKIWINGEYQGTAGDINLADDRFTDGQYVDDFLLFYELSLGDTVEVEKIALTQNFSNYLNDWSTILNANGGPFDPPLSPLIGNVFVKGSTTDFANGYFHATSQTRVTSVVSE